jgi:hypothetical protein
MCRSNHCNARLIESYNRKRTSDTHTPSDSQCNLRSSEPSFRYREQCIFCGVALADHSGGRRKEYKLIAVKTHDFQCKISDACNKRNQDTWAVRVKARIDNVHDLHAADAVYHNACSVNFRNVGKQIPQQFLSKDERSSKRMKLGRPKGVSQAEAFIKVIDFLKANDDEQITVGDLIQKMADYLDDEDCKPYSFPHMKAQIKEHFGDKIIITDINGKANVVTFVEPYSAAAENMV